MRSDRIFRSNGRAFYLSLLVPLPIAHQTHPKSAHNQDPRSRFSCAKLVEDGWVTELQELPANGQGNHTLHMSEHTRTEARQWRKKVKSARCQPAGLSGSVSRPAGTSSSVRGPQQSKVVTILPNHRQNKPAWDDLDPIMDDLKLLKNIFKWNT